MLKLNKFFVCLVLLLSFCSTALAQTYHPYRLPQGTRLQVSGATYQGFNLTEYQTLLNMDNDLREADVVVAATTEQVRLLQEGSTQLHLALDACTDIRTTLETDRAYLNGELSRVLTENRALQENQDLNIIPWVVAGVLLVTTVILGALLAI